MINLIRHSNDRTVTLTKEIANSGEGQVWETNISGYLAKIYHDPTPARIRKLKFMLANPPADPMLSQNYVSIAWVSDLLKDNSGKYLGFLMPAIENSKQLSSICNPKSRKRNAPGFNWYYLHVTALNTAWIIQEIHAKDYVLGDIKLENILVNDRAMTAIVDTDSFQAWDPQYNKIYRCTVGSEGFTPPELIGKDFDTINQNEIHDRFRLGVLSHYLLFGYHPFSGNWTGVGECPEQTELIKQGYWMAVIIELIKQQGQSITVVGQIASTRYYSKNTNKFLINFGKSKTTINGYSKKFRVVIFFEGIQNLARIENLNIDDLRKWKNSYVKITGILELAQIKSGNKILQIILKESTQIKLINQVEANQLLSQTSTIVGFSQTKKPSSSSQALPQYPKQNLSPTKSSKSANSPNIPTSATFKRHNVSPNVTQQTSYNSPKSQTRFFRDLFLFKVIVLASKFFIVILFTKIFGLFGLILIGCLLTIFFN